MRYEFRLVDISCDPSARGRRAERSTQTNASPWPITAYGKTPTAFLQSDEEAVNLAAVVALRDAGAHFITTFGSTPGCPWLMG